MVYPFHGRGGMQKYVYTLGKFLNKKGIDVEIVTSSAGNKNIRKVTYENVDFTLLNQKIGHIGCQYDLSFYKHLCHVINSMHLYINIQIFYIGLLLLEKLQH